MSKTFPFQAIQFSISTQFSFIRHIDRTLSGATTSGQSGCCSDGNGGALPIPQSSSLTGTSASDSLVSYLGHSLWGSYSSAEMQSVYSTAPVDWATYFFTCMCIYKVYMYGYVCLSMCAYVCMHVDEYMYVCVCVIMCMHLRVDAYTCFIENSWWIKVLIKIVPTQVYKRNSPLWR